MKHITQAGSVFRLTAGRTALLLQITKYGHVELLHLSLIHISEPTRPY